MGVRIRDQNRGSRTEKVMGAGTESVIADLQVELFQKGDSLNDPISLVVHAFYGPPHSARSMPAVGEARRLYTLRK